MRIAFAPSQKKRIAFRQISKDGYKQINIERQRVRGAQTDATIICSKYILDISQPALFMGKVWRVENKILSRMKIK